MPVRAGGTPQSPHAGRFDKNMHLIGKEKANHHYLPEDSVAPAGSSHVHPPD